MNKSRGTGGKNDRELAYGKSIFGAALGTDISELNLCQHHRQEFPARESGKKDIDTSRRT